MPIRSQFDTEAEWLSHMQRWFAGMALAGILSSFPEDASFATAQSKADLAADSYDLAAAMLAELARRQGGGE